MSDRNMHWPNIEIPAFSGYAPIKRFLDHWLGDLSFRKAFAADPEATIAASGHAVDAQEMRWFVDPELADLNQLAIPDLTLPIPPDAPPSLLAYRRYLEARFKERDRRQVETIPDDDRLARWRLRQLARCALQLPPAYSQRLLHGPFAIELSSGCTAGCWFCAVSALPFSGHFSHDAAGAAMFRSVLSSLSDVFGGSAAGEGFLYWATDPLDNPEYEAFLSDFAAEFGRVPPTISSLANTDLDRTRRLLRQIAAHPHWMQRFSLTSRKAFNDVMEAFSPEETLYVELLPIFAKHQGLTRSGRALEVATALEEAGKAPPVQLTDVEATCSCISGFLINMVEKTVKLISPCPACEAFPDGYICFGSTTFGEEGGSFKAAVQRLCSTVDTRGLEGDDAVEIARGLTVKSLQDGELRVDGVGGTVTFRHPAATASFAESLAAPAWCRDVIAKAGDAAQTFDFLNMLFDSGIVLLAQETPFTAASQETEQWRYSECGAVKTG